MPEVKVMRLADNERPGLLEKQKRKLWLSGALLTVAGVGFLVPNNVADMLGISEAAVELGALLLTFVGFGWAIFSVRCQHCGLRLVMHAISNQSIGQWLHWLLTVKTCPRCGAEHDGQVARKP